MNRPAGVYERRPVPVVNSAGTGRNIDRLRRDAGMSVREMQDVFGFTTPQAVYKWIRGKSVPTVDNLVVLSALFGVSIDDIVAVDWT